MTTSTSSDAARLPSIVMASHVLCALPVQATAQSRPAAHANVDSWHAPSPSHASVASLKAAERHAFDPLQVAVSPSTWRSSLHASLPEHDRAEPVKLEP